MRKKVLLISIIFVIMIISAYLIISIAIEDSEGFLIEITNETDESIEGLQISYDDLNTYYKVPSIKPKEKIEIRIVPDEIISESSMIIYYNDNRGYLQKNILVGYFERGYRGKVEVELYSIDANGLILMRIEEHIKLY